MKSIIYGSFRVRFLWLLLCTFILIPGNSLATEYRIDNATRTMVGSNCIESHHKSSHSSSHIKKWCATSTRKATLICVHALGLSSHAYSDFASKFSKQGYDVYAIDVRGFGYNRIVEGRDKLDLNRTVGDIKILVKAVKNSNPELPIFLIGESMGGAVVLKAASSYPNMINGVLVSAPAYKLFKLKRLTLKGLGDLILPGTGPAARSVIVQATSSEKLRHHWKHDSLNHKLELSFGEAISYYRFVRNTPKYSTEIKEVPVCIMHGLHDHLAKPTGSAKLFKKLKSDDKLLIIDCQAEHIMLEEKQLTDRIANLTNQWLNIHIEKTAIPVKKRLIVIREQLLDAVDKAKLEKIKSASGTKLDNAQVSHSMPML